MIQTRTFNRAAEIRAQQDRNQAAARLQTDVPDPQPGPFVYLPGHGLRAADRMRLPHMGTGMVELEGYFRGLGQNLMHPEQSRAPTTIFKTPRMQHLYLPPPTVYSPPVKVCINSPFTAPLYR